MVDLIINEQLDEDCAVLNNLYNGVNSGKWNDAACDGKKSVLCKARANPENSIEPEVEMCEDKEGYLKFNDGCYKWFEEEKTWEEAEQDCFDQEAHLVSIWDNLEQAYVFTNVKTIQSWIGLRKAEVSALILLSQIFRHFSFL